MPPKFMYTFYLTVDFDLLFHSSFFFLDGGADNLLKQIKYIDFSFRNIS